MSKHTFQNRIDLFIEHSLSILLLEITRGKAKPLRYGLWMYSITIIIFTPQAAGNLPWKITEILIETNVLEIRWGELN